MILIDILILALCIIPDVIWQVMYQGIQVKMSLATLFLIYVAFRGSFRRVMILVILFYLLTRSFTALSFFSMSASYLLILFIASRVRSQIYTEAYLTQSIWVFILIALHQLFLNVIVVDLFDHHLMFRLLISILLNSLLAMLMTIPFFMILDAISDLFSLNQKRRDDYSSGQYKL